jgi:hypothetical protein
MARVGIAGRSAPQRAVSPNQRRLTFTIFLPERAWGGFGQSATLDFCKRFQAWLWARLPSWAEQEQRLEARQSRPAACVDDQATLRVLLGPPRDGDAVLGTALSTFPSPTSSSAPQLIAYRLSIACAHFFVFGSVKEASDLYATMVPQAPPVCETLHTTANSQKGLEPGGV